MSRRPGVTNQLVHHASSHTISITRSMLSSWRVHVEERKLMSSVHISCVHSCVGVHVCVHCMCVPVWVQC